MTQSQFSMRIPVELSEKLRDLSKATGRSKSYLATQALQSFIDQEAWQIEIIQKAIIEADEGKFATPAQVKALHDKCGYNAN